MVDIHVTLTEKELQELTKPKASSREAWQPGCRKSLPAGSRPWAHVVLWTLVCLPVVPPLLCGLFLLWHHHLVQHLSRVQRRGPSGTRSPVAPAPSSSIQCSSWPWPLPWASAAVVQLSWSWEAWWQAARTWRKASVVGYAK